LGTAKNLTVAAVALAFTGHIVWWMAAGRDRLEGLVATTATVELERAIRVAQEKGGCVPRHLVLETKTPDADPLSQETLSLLASRCQDLGVEFHPEPPVRDLGCRSDRCGDCLGYAQQIRFATPFVSAARTYYFRGDVFQESLGYWYVWYLGSWHEISEPKYRGE
jgi:hypothetical protein